MAPDDTAGADVVESGVVEVVGSGNADIVVVAAAGEVVAVGAAGLAVSAVDPPQAAIARMNTVAPAKVRINGAYVRYRLSAIGLARQQSLLARQPEDAARVVLPDCVRTETEGEPKPATGRPAFPHSAYVM